MLLPSIVMGLAARIASEIQPASDFKIASIRITAISVVIFALSSTALEKQSVRQAFLEEVKEQHTAEMQRQRVSYEVQLTKLRAELKLQSTIASEGEQAPLSCGRRTSQAQHHHLRWAKTRVLKTDTRVSKRAFKKH